MKKSTIKHEEKNERFYIYFSQKLFLNIIILISIILCLLVILIETTTLIKLLLSTLIILSNLLIMVFLIPKSAHIEIYDKKNCSLRYCTSFILNRKKKTDIRNIESIKISKNIHDDFIIFKTADSLCKLPLGVSLLENKRIALLIADYLENKIIVD